MCDTPKKSMSLRVALGLMFLTGCFSAPEPSRLRFTPGVADAGGTGTPISTESTTLTLDNSGNPGDVVLAEVTVMTGQDDQHILVWPAGSSQPSNPQLVIGRRTNLVPRLGFFPTGDKGAVNLRSLDEDTSAFIMPFGRFSPDGTLGFHSGRPASTVWESGQQQSFSADVPLADHAPADTSYVLLQLSFFRGFEGGITSVAMVGCRLDSDANVMLSRVCLAPVQNGVLQIWVENSAQAEFQIDQVGWFAPSADGEFVLAAEPMSLLDINADTDPEAVANTTESVSTGPAGIIGAVVSFGLKDGDGGRLGVVGASWNDHQNTPILTSEGFEAFMMTSVVSFPNDESRVDFTNVELANVVGYFVEGKAD